MGATWKVKMLLLMGKTKGSLQKMVNVFSRVCGKGMVKINGEKSKIMWVGEEEFVMKCR